MSGAMLGVASLLVLVATTALWFRKAMAVRLSGSRAPYIAGWALAALLGVAAFVRGPGGLLAGLGAGLSLVAGAFLLGLVSISRQQAAPDAVRVGATLPDFTAPTDDGEPFTLSGLEGRPILLKFFRGHW